MSDPRSASAYAFDQLSVSQEVGRMIRQEAKARGESINDCLLRHFGPMGLLAAPGIARYPGRAPKPAPKHNGPCPSTHRIRGELRGCRRKDAHAKHRWWSPYDSGVEWEDQ